MSGVWIFNKKAGCHKQLSDAELSQIASDGVGDTLVMLRRGTEILSVLAIWLATVPDGNPIKAKFTIALECMKDAENQLTAAADLIDRGGPGSS